MRVTKFAGDVTWPVVPHGCSRPSTDHWRIRRGGGDFGVREEAAGLVCFLYETGTVDRPTMTLDEAIAAAEEEGDKLGSIELPATSASRE